LVKHVTIYIIYNIEQYGALARSVGFARSYFSSGPTLGWDATNILQEMKSTRPCSLSRGILMGEIVLLAKIPLREQITTGVDIAEEREKATEFETSAWFNLKWPFGTYFTFEHGLYLFLRHAMKAMWGKRG
jgi:hypothetical protein